MSVIALTDDTGAILERYAYDAYGEPVFLNGSGTVISSSAENNRYTYTGREWDADLVLYHFRARMYDPEAGRFLGRDPIGFGTEARNLYVFLSGNSLAYVDWSGRVRVRCDCYCSWQTTNGPRSKIIDCPSISGARGCCERECNRGSACSLSGYDLVWDPSNICEHLKNNPNCAGCTSGNCEKEIRELLDAADEHETDVFPSTCQAWVFEYAGPKSGKCFSSKTVIFKYPFGVPCTSWFLRHVVIEITLCDGSKFFLDSGWWGGDDNCCLPPDIKLCKKEGEMDGRPQQ